MTGPDPMPLKLYTYDELVALLMAEWDMERPEVERIIALAEQEVGPLGTTLQ